MQMTEGVDYYYKDGRFVLGAPPGATDQPTTGTPTTTTGTGYQYSPSPTAGKGAFGAVPGQIGVPDPAKDLAAQLPGLSNLNQQASDNILTQLKGEVSPDTIRAIQDASASWGVQSGMPGSGLAVNAGLRDVGQTSENLQQQGQQNLNAMTSSVSNTQTASPELQAQVAMQNAANAAAPDPTAAAQYSQSLFDQYLRMMNPVQVSESFSTSPSGTTTSTGVRTEYDPLTGMTTRG